MNIRRPSDIRKKQNKRDLRKKYIIAGGGIVFLLLVVGGVIGIKQSTLFRISSVSVTGVPDAYGEQIVRDLEDFSRQHSFLFRFLGSDNLLAWDGTPTAFLDANPQFKTIQVVKDYIRRTITIVVDTREKFGVWCSVGGNTDAVSGDTEASSTTDTVIGHGMTSDDCFWFDHDGVLFSRAPGVNSELFNRVYDSTGRTLGLREKILPDRLFVNLAKVFKLMEVAQVNTKTVFVRDLALEEVDADSVSDPKMTFSLRFDPAFALSAIDALKHAGTWPKLQYVNFTVEDKVSYK